MSELGGDNGREVMIRFAKLNGGEGAADIFTDLASRTDDKVERNNLRKMYLEVVRDSPALAAIQIEIPTRFGKAQPRRVTVIKYRLDLLSHARVLCYFDCTSTPQICFLVCGDFPTVP